MMANALSLSLVNFAEGAEKTFLCFEQPHMVVLTSCSYPLFFCCCLFHPLRHIRRRVAVLYSLYPCCCCRTVFPSLSIQQCVCAIELASVARKRSPRCAYSNHMNKECPIKLGGEPKAATAVADASDAAVLPEQHFFCISFTAMFFLFR